MRTASPTLMLSALLTLAGPAAGQVTARQGTASAERLEFESPMILELALPDILALPSGSALRLASVGKYVCDHDVTLGGLSLTKREKGRKIVQLDVSLTGFVFVAESHDRGASVAVRLKSGERVLASGLAPGISAEEEARTPFRVQLAIGEAELREAYQLSPAPTIELTLTVRDNS